MGQADAPRMLLIGILDRVGVGGIWLAIAAFLAEGGRMSEADLLAGGQELVRDVRGGVAEVVGGVLVVAERSVHLTW